jgi:thioesterase domain-containing protein/acyl carrier protein
MYVGGAGLARGYLNRSELTQERFIPHPFSREGTAHLYRSGDLARYLPDGDVEYLGRIDHQIKIRGFRIELGEIETALTQHPAVREAVVVVREDTLDEKRLVAYLTLTEEENLMSHQLHQFLKGKLPDYMIPSAWAILPALPLTTNGKIDRRALPPLDQVDFKPAKNFTAPRDNLELQLTQLWSQLLGTQAIGIHDNFFELGGHSLLAVRLLAQIEQAFGQRLPLATLFQAPTIAQLAQVLGHTHWSPPWSSLVALQPSGSRPPFFCLPGNLGNVFVDLGDLARYLGPDQPFYGLQDGVHNPAQIKTLACQYLNEIRTVQPNGPYFLGGICSGGVIAFEIAQQLWAQDQQVALLALIEPPRPPGPGLQTYLDFSTILLRGFVQRFTYHSRLLWQDNSPEQGSYTRLKAKVLANLWAMVRYTPQPYPGRISLFLGEESRTSVSRDPRLAWQSLAGSGLDIHFVPGNHNTITRTHEAIPLEADIRVLAEQLKSCMDQVLVNL